MAVAPGGRISYCRSEGTSNIQCGTAGESRQHLDVRCSMFSSSGGRHRPMGIRVFWQCKPERRALVRRAFCPDVSAMALDDALDDRQAEAGALELFSMQPSERHP